MKKLILVILGFLFLCEYSIGQSFGNLESQKKLSDDGHISELITTGASEKGISLNENQVNSANISTYKDSDIWVVDLCDEDSETEDFVAYIRDNSVYFVHVFISTIDENVKNYRFESLDREQLYFSLSLNEKSEVGDIVLGEDIVGMGLPRGPQARVPCPTKTKKFGDCMDCAYQECYSSWKCGLMCSAGAFVLACVAGFTLACTGVQ
jgi:hypothetical protein